MVVIKNIIHQKIILILFPKKDFKVHLAFIKYNRYFEKSIFYKVKPYVNCNWEKKSLSNRKQMAK